MRATSGRRVILGTALVALGLAGPINLPEGPAGAVVSPDIVSTGTVSGRAWQDLNSNGVLDVGESGLAHVIITVDGTAARVETGSDGRWSLVVPAGPVTLTAITGWLPSACPGDLRCPAWRTADQAFEVENQVLRARVNVTAGGSVSGLRLGLEPDYGDPTGSPTSLITGNDRGDGTARVHDLAVRNSNIGWYKGCTDPDKTRVCPIGTTISNAGQIYNQGTAWVSAIRFVVTVPPGTVLASDPVPYIATPGPKPVRTGRTGRCVDGSTWIEFALGTSLPPAGSVWFITAYKIVSGPLTPTPYPSGRNYDRKGYFSISAVTPSEDDSTLRVDPRQGLDAGHNVNWPVSRDDDTSDAVEFNVG